VLVDELLTTAQTGFPRDIPEGQDGLRGEVQEYCNRRVSKDMEIKCACIHLNIGTTQKKWEQASLLNP
jgi:hypothetical protein